ncbi:hypothetical protein [Kaarinaea lacus]
MIKLVNSIQAWGTPEFETVLKKELKQLDPDLLPLQQGMSQSSYATGNAIDAVVLNSTENANTILVKAGIFYSGVIAGSCCADDPTPVEEQTEYCEVQLTLNKDTGDATVSLLRDSK